MKTALALFAAVAAIASMAGSAASAAVLDNFNRPDSSTLGPGWTQQAGTSGIVGDQAFGSNQSLATFNGGSGDTVSFDISNPTNSTSYVAAVLGWGSAYDYFVKVQNNGGSAFDTYSFGTGNNSDVTFTDLSGSFTSAHVVVSVIGTLATLDIFPNVGAEQIYTFNYGPGLSGGGIGLGFYGGANADNFGAGAVPEPATWALMLAGFAGLGLALRRRAKPATA
ncbi:MAG TPA: PEPxxWA-CTERM sorting domain-containing protein [Caulobacteraceae bacterium]|jgi:hypothetical protein